MVNPMADFYVHWNVIVRRVRIHRSECGACNNGRGMHKGKIAAGRGETYDWQAAESYREAQAIAKASPPARRGAKVADCGLCHPGRSR